jgi:hypothetical protein
MKTIADFEMAALDFSSFQNTTIMLCSFSFSSTELSDKLSTAYLTSTRICPRA